jgi:hypothetical protein
MNVVGNLRKEFLSRPQRNTKVYCCEFPPSPSSVKDTIDDEDEVSLNGDESNALVIRHFTLG